MKIVFLYVLNEIILGGGQIMSKNNVKIYFENKVIFVWFFNKVFLL